MDELIKDDRFKHIVNDAKFKILPKNERKFKVDKRFKVNQSFLSLIFNQYLIQIYTISKNMFHDKQFKLKYSVDKRGRPVNLTTNDNLKKFYQLSSDEEEEDENDDTDVNIKNKANLKSKKIEQKGKTSKDEDDKEDIKEKETGSSDEEESDDVNAASEHDGEDDSEESESSISDSSDEDDYESTASEESGKINLSINLIFTK
jgi:hypothetical protein